MVLARAKKEYGPPFGEHSPNEALLIVPIVW